MFSKVAGSILDNINKDGKVWKRIGEFEKNRKNQ